MSQPRILRSSQISVPSEEDTGIWYLVRFKSDNLFGIIKERDIEVVDLASRNVLVKEMSKKHQAKYLSRGNNFKKFLNYKKLNKFNLKGTQEKCEADAAQFELEISVISDSESIDVESNIVNNNLPSQAAIPNTSSNILNDSQNITNSPSTSLTQNQIEMMVNQIKTLNEKIEDMSRVGRIPSVVSLIKKKLIRN